MLLWNCRSIFPRNCFQRLTYLKHVSITHQVVERKCSRHATDTYHKYVATHEIPPCIKSANGSGVAKVLILLNNNTC